MSASADPAAGRFFEAARMADLAELTEYVDGECRRAGVGGEAAFAVRLAVEEAFTNIVQHGYAGRPGPVRCTVRGEPDRVVVTLVDEAPAFDPSQAPAPDLESAWDERPEGGLGWHLVHGVMDEVRHEPGPGRGNVLTLVKRLPSRGQG